jgi:hypothetical protein
MFVYFIRCGNSELIKIGKADDVERRLEELQTGNPYELHIMFKINCNSPMAAFDMERKIHKTFSAHRFRSEWFRIPIRQFQKMQIGEDTTAFEFTKNIVTPRAIRRKARREKRKKKEIMRSAKSVAHCQVSGTTGAHG